MAQGRTARQKLDGKRIEDRVTQRATRRLMVRFGVQGADKTGFTRNISESGLFVQTNAVFAPGSTIQVQIHFPDRTISFWARVAWAKKVPPQLSHLLDCGMGLHFVEPGADWKAFFTEWKEKVGIR
jgi:hypothetical protein